MKQFCSILIWIFLAPCNLTFQIKYIFHIHGIYFTRPSGKQPINNVHLCPTLSRHYYSLLFSQLGNVFQTSWSCHRCRIHINVFGSRHCAQSLFSLSSQMKTPAVAAASFSSKNADWCSQWGVFSEWICKVWTWNLNHSAALQVQALQYHLQSAIGTRGRQKFVKWYLKNLGRCSLCTRGS